VPDVVRGHGLDAMRTIGQMTGIRHATVLATFLKTKNHADVREIEVSSNGSCSA
jgi:hypothetical protein